MGVVSIGNKNAQCNLAHLIDHCNPRDHHKPVPVQCLTFYDLNPEK